MTPIEKLLPRLEKVQETGIGRWSACCPAHDDHNPSLAITELGDGMVLVYCRALCGGVEVVRAVGLEMSDLFPPEANGASRRRRWNHREVIEAAKQEALIATIGLDQVIGGAELSTEDLERMRASVNRLRGLLEVT